MQDAGWGQLPANSLNYMPFANIVHVYMDASPSQAGYKLFVDTIRIELKEQVRAHLQGSCDQAHGQDNTLFPVRSACGDPVRPSIYSVLAR